MLLTGAVRLTILPKENHCESLSVCELDTQPSNWEADTLPLSYRRRSEIFVANAEFQEMLWRAVGALLRNQSYKKKD